MIKNVKDNPYVSIAIDVVDGKPEDISYLNAKAVIIEGKAEVKDDINGSFAKKMYGQYVGKDALNNPMVQFSIGMPIHILVIKPVKVISWDLAKLANPIDKSIPCFLSHFQRVQLDCIHARSMNVPVKIIPYFLFQDLGYYLKEYCHLRR